MNSILRPPLRRIARFPLRGVLRDDAPFFLRNALYDINGDNITKSGGAVTSMINQGTGGDAFDANVVVGGGDNLKLSLSDAVLLYGAIGDFASSPDSSAASITDAIDIIAKAALDNWSAGTNQSIVSKQTAAGNQRSYVSAAGSTGELFITINANGAGGGDSSPSTVSVPFANGVTGWIRETYDPSTLKANSFTFPDSLNLPALSDWNLLGDPDIANTEASIFDSTAVLEIGSINAGTANLATGVIFRGQVYSGIGGTLAVDFNAADYINRTSDTEFPSSATGEEWTLNGNSFIQNTGHDVVHSIGGAALETTAGQVITTKWTRFIVARFTDPNPTGDQVLFDSRDDAGKSVKLYTDFSNSNRWTWDAGGTPKALSEDYDTDFHVFTIQQNKDGTSKLTVSDVGSIEGDAGTEDLEVGTIMADLAGLNPAPVAFASDTLFDREMKESEVSSMQDFRAKEYKIEE